MVLSLDLIEKKNKARHKALKKEHMNLFRVLREMTGTLERVEGYAKVKFISLQTCGA